MKEYIVTVHYSLRVKATDEDEAERIASDLDLGEGYVTDSFEITDVHESLVYEGGKG